MGNHLDRRVVLVEGVKYPFSCGWALQEFNDTGDKIGFELVPWHRGCKFDVEQIVINDNIKRERSYDTVDANVFEWSDDCVIIAKLFLLDAITIRIRPLFICLGRNVK